MDFFAQQDQARRNTRLLLVLFSFAVLLLILLTNGFITAFLWLQGEYNLYSGGSGLSGYLAQFSWERFLTVAFIVVSVVGLVSMVNWLQLASGGKAVAESMGGRQILAGSGDFFEQRCHNIVQELALAANMPVPALYLLPDERGINAFAAGTKTTDAVVAVTRGAVRQLTREEMQGVIGHEFSHILNGDMRLGIRLAALLKGITFIGDVGHILLRAGSYRRGFNARRSESSAALPLLGLGFLFIGSIGAFAAGFIKAAISRQKEYLADASAVQFTRSSSGIADALKVIGGFIPGSLVHTARANEMGHIFFGEVTHHIWNPFATHPPLEKRIHRLDGNWDGNFIARREVHLKETPETAGDIEAGIGREAVVLTALASMAVRGDIDLQGDADFSADASEGTVTTEERKSARFNDLVTAAQDPLGAEALVIALLLVRDRQLREEALNLVAEQGANGLKDQVLELAPLVEQLAAGERFPIVACAIPALKTMSTPQYRQFKSTLLSLIRLDKQTDIFEWCLFQLVRHYLDGEFLRVKTERPRYSHLAKVRGPLRLVLSVLAHQGDGDSAIAFQAAQTELGMEELSLMPLAECSISEFSRAVHTLAECYPLLKPRILKAMALAATDDGVVSAQERELVVAVAAVMNCPVPPDFDFGPTENDSGSRETTVG